MARRTANLAGLAALGALGYALTRGGGAPVEDRVATPVAPEAEPEADTGDFISRRMKINPETGMAYGVEGPMGAPRVAAAAVREAGAGRGGQGGPTAAELRAYQRGTNSRAGGVGMERYVPRRRPEAASATYNPPPMTPEMRRQAEAQALEGVYPETMAVAPGIKTVASLARAAAARTGGRGAAAEAAPFLRELPAPGARQALPAPTQRLTGPSKGALKESERAGRAATRQEEMLRENASRYGLDPNAPGYEAAMRALRENIGGSSFTVKKKGGAIKAKPTKKMASGGATKSASRRGDGIATRGKTRGKLY